MRGKKKRPKSAGEDHVLWSKASKFLRSRTNKNEAHIDDRSSRSTYRSVTSEQTQSAEEDHVI